MQKTFICKSCKHRFSADDQADCNCPKCGSENVSPVSATENLPKFLILGLTLIVSVGLGIWGGKELKGPDGPGPEIKDPDTPIVKIPINLRCTSPVRDATYHYSFTAKSNIKGEFLLIEGKDSLIIDQKKDGFFSNIPASHDNGVYILRIKTDDGRKEDMLISGFEPKPITKVDKLSKEDLQKLFDNLDERLQTNKHPQLSKNVKIDIISKRENDPIYISGIISQIRRGQWINVKIVSVEYDKETNQVNKITISRDINN